MVPTSPSENPAPTAGPDRSLKINPWFYALLSCFLLLVFFGARLINDFDLGYHLKGGQWILENHTFPSKDTYTYTVPDHDYVDLHWLYQVPLYLLYRLGGYSLLSLTNIAALLLVFFITYRRLRLTGAPLWMCVLLLGVVLIGSEIRFQVRPEILSWLLMCLTLWILELRLTGGKNLLYLLIPIQVVWANVEGLFLIGWGLLAFYLVSGYLHARKADRKLLRFSALASASCLLNPYFIKGVLFPFILLSTLATSNVFKANINEFQSPWTLARHYPFPPDWTLWAYESFSVLLLLLLMATFKKRKLHDWLLAGSFFYLSTASLRNIPLFMLSCAPLAASCWKDLKWEKLHKIASALFSRPAAAWAFSLFMLALCLRVATGAYYVSERREERFGLGLDAEKQPVRAAQFLVQNRLEGRLLNHMNAGGWLDWAAPQKVFIDGRLEVMGEKFFREYIESLERGGLAPLLARYQADILFFNPEETPTWVMDLKDLPVWRPVYLDESAVICLRKDYAPQVPKMDDTSILAQRGIAPAILEEKRTLLETPKPSAWVLFWRDFCQKDQYPTGLNVIGAYYNYSGKFNLAEMVFLENIRRTQGRYYDLFYNLGAMYYSSKRLDDSKLCIQRVMQDVSHEALARQIQANLPRH